MDRVKLKLAMQDKEAVKNTYHNAPKVIPSINKIDDYTLEVKTMDSRAEIKWFQEIVLFIISDFKYAPIWLLYQWYNDFEIEGCKKEIKSWVDTGLVWVQSLPTGLYLRPTRFLLNLYNLEGDYSDIPYSLLVHDVSEEQVVFDVMSGNPKSELWSILREDELLPPYHPLELKGEGGAIAIRENSFRLGYRRMNVKQTLEREEETIRSIKSGSSLTLELTEFERFPIVKFNTKNQAGKEDIVVQTPDVIVPALRQFRKPKSAAIEIELSSKTADRYEGIMDSYKDNVKFGKLFYLCGNSYIASQVKKAFNKVDGLGDCELYIVPFTPPSMKMEDAFGNM